MSGSAALGPRERRFAGAWTIAIVTGAAAFVLAGRAYRELDRPRPLEELSYYPSGKHVRAATLGHEETVADLAWLRAVQYYGEHRRTDNRFERLPHLFDILTSLSPRFVPAYVFAAFALAQEGSNFAAAERLMLKGLEANPQSGRLAFELGFLYYVRPGGRDLEHAAIYFEQAARQPDAPPQSARFAAFARQNAGDLRMAYELWSAVYERSPNRYMRDIAERNLRKIREAVDKGRRELAVRRLSTPGVVVRGAP